MRKMKDLQRRYRSMRKNGLRVVFLLSFFHSFIFLIACSSIDCPVENVVATVYKLQKSDGTPDTLYDSLTVFSRRKNGTDTILLDHITSTTQFQLQVGHTNPEDTLYFMVSNGSYSAQDVVFIKKENTPHFESVDCSIAYFHEITGVRLDSHNVIDSISIIKTEVNYDLSSEHFHIYFKARR